MYQSLLKAKKMDNNNDYDDYDEMDLVEEWRNTALNGYWKIANHQKISKLLSTGRLDPNTVNRYNGQTYVQTICSFLGNDIGENSLEIMKLFVNHPNFDVNYIDRYGFALIHYCVRMQNCDFLEILLRSTPRNNINRINVNILFDTTASPQSFKFPPRDFAAYDGYTALNLLFRNNNLPFRDKKLRLLMENGANPNIVGRNGYGPIHNLIVYYRHRLPDDFCDDMRRLLLPFSSSAPPPPQADPNLRMQLAHLVWFTPLHLAVRTRCPLYVFDALLRGGADATLRDSSERTPLQYADDVNFDDAAVRRLLKEYDPELQEMRRLAGVTLWRRLEHNRDLYLKIYRESGLL
jgi:ankyrin repeat protein